MLLFIKLRDLSKSLPTVNFSECFTVEAHSEYKIKAHNEKAQYPKNLPKGFPGIQKNSQTEDMQ